ncbi:unnamed protein product, partial [Durusdinium trenchii]
DIQSRLLRTLGPTFLKRGWNFDVEIMGTVRDWAKLAPDRVTFKNCFKTRKFEEDKDTVPVVGMKNLGDHVNAMWQDVAKMEQVIFPNNQQIYVIYKEFLEHGYKGALGTVLIKFPHRDGTRSIPAGSVGLVDGFAKIMVMLSVVLFIKELELLDQALEDPTLRKTLQRRTLEQYVQDHQDKSRNALQKSLQAAFAAWKEELAADQAAFAAEKLALPGYQLVVSSDDHVSAGTSFVRATMEAFSLPTEKGCCLVDLFGYDGTPMLACLEELCEGKNCCVGTVCLDASGSSLSTRVANKVFDAARSKKVKLNAFPDISSLVASLKRGHAVESTTTYRVTARQNDRLVIVKNLAEKWLNEESTSDEAKRIIEQHNKEHNANGEYMTASAPAVEPPPKRVKLEEDATDVQKNSSRWFSFDVKKDDLIFLERKSVPESLRQMECVESVMSVQSILSDLEDQGE